MKPARQLLAAAWMAGALASAAAAPVFAQVPPGCSALCAVTCVKPISIPDRWDDVTAIAGYSGGGRTQPNWRENALYDQENYTDANANGLYDVGESFVDANGNGLHDAEFYDPLLTGYNADPNPLHRLAPAGDLGMELIFHPGSPGSAPSLAQYFTVGLPAINRGTPLVDDDSFRANLATCNPSLVGPGDQLRTTPASLVGPMNQGARDLIGQDPNAYWDPVTLQVAGSDFALSPRVFIVPVHDPRLPLSPTFAVTVRRVLAVFVEEMTGPAEFRARLMTAQGSGELCGAGENSGGFVVLCATPATPMTWGKMKSLYR